MTPTPEETRATTLGEVWNNFRPSDALSPESIFRVERTDIRSGRSVRDLERAKENDKWFLTGHRGCGKSTHLRHVFAQKEVREKYCPIRYRISDVADMNDLDYQDLLFTIASQLVKEALGHNAIKEKLEKRLISWGQTIVEETNKAESAEAGVKGGLDTLFVGFTAKLQTQHSTRRQFRRVVEPQVSELINIIDDVTTALEQKLKKSVLVAIDDLERTTVPAARKLFGNYLVSLEKPKCHIIYTVPVALMHDNAWENLKYRAWPIPNIKLNERNHRSAPNAEGRELMKEFIEKRMNLDLITEDALQDIITYGGGVFRQTCLLMQTAADYAEDRDKTVIDADDVRATVAEQSNGLLPQLTREDLTTLKRIAKDNGAQLAYESSKLLHNLSVLRYPNEHDWHDVNPVLWELVETHEPDDAANF